MRITTKPAECLIAVLAGFATPMTRTRECTQEQSVTHTLVLLANGFGRRAAVNYPVETGPQLLVRPNPAGTNVSLSMVHAGAGSAGFEWRAPTKQAFAIYYGADYFGRNFFPDTTD